MKQRTADPYRETDVIDANAPRFNQARLRGIRGHLLDRIDLGELGVDPEHELVVQFTHPLCTDCRALEDRLRAEGHRLVVVDVSRRPELARKYGVGVVPIAVAVGRGGTVTARLAG